jgi:GNAT superfamily N-acetyltransferase
MASRGARQGIRLRQLLPSAESLRLHQTGEMDEEVRRLVDKYWASRFGLSSETFPGGGVHVVTGELGANVAFSLHLDKAWVVVVPAARVEAARAALSELDATAVLTPDLLRNIAGLNVRLEGPSLHSYVSERMFRGGTDPAVESTDGTDPLLVAFLKDCGLADWAESGFPQEPSSADPETTKFWVLREGGRIVAAGNMTEWRGVPADVGVLTHPHSRGRGLATRVVATMVADMLPTVAIVRHRALAENRPSLAVARTLGFEPYGQNYRARRLPA